MAIPNYDLLSVLKDTLNYNGIFTFSNLRCETFNEYSMILERLRKRYKKVIEINLRIYCGFIICWEDKNAKPVNYYNSNDIILDKNILEKIDKNLKKSKKTIEYKYYQLLIY